MSLKKRWDAGLMRVAKFGFRLRELTAVFGVKNPAALAELLEVDDGEAPYAKVYGLHNLRWVSFDAAESGGVASIEGSAHVLVFSLVCDGNVEDVLEELMRVARPRFCEILSHCVGFLESTEPLSFIEKHRVPCGYLFRDLGPLLTKDDSVEPEADATRAEIEDAFASQARFERFYAEFGFESGPALRAAYLRAFGDEALPLPLAPWERARSDEASATRRAMDVLRKRQDNAARRRNSRRVLRGVHAKAHGLLAADFEVVPSPFKVGLFAEEGTFKALLRPSNGFHEVRKDGAADARGLALRVLIPARPPGEGPRFITPPPAGEPGFQDFILVNYPVFFSPDIQAFSLLLQAAHLSRLADKLLSVAALTLRSGGIKQLFHFARMLSSKVSHPLQSAFHSESAYQLGPEHIAKYSIEPSHPARLSEVARAAGDGDDGLSAALKASLEEDPVRLKLFVHVLPTSEPPHGFASLADVVEDATLSWDALGAVKHHVGNIVVGAKQDPTSADILDAAERIRFSPWNALVDHRPLGSLNRARWTAYRASQAHRSGGLAVAVESQALAAE